ncbi:hypothetical protein K1T71_006226 [Dendrolimus kikuchii]|uniref:Uncharacterized protein n=1 Tax=Dendrolimus kikuchii TaxID=765133 RepID=A0ACC1D3B6_9NEOP|nr:hypothetical protein K1T71_006226 [Dendrolimus kikuchii]
METILNFDKVGDIKPINTETVHKICSGQVVLSLAVAVKELVENALDAGATNIDIRLKNYGVDLIEVSDNGTGVTEDNLVALTQKYHTSKLSDYSDLLGVTSFGFRGEALSSLCALANLIITTRHKTSEYATKIEYDYKGSITKKTPCSRQIGTTVSLTNLFHSLPVRLKEFHKNVKREFNKMTQLLYAYCLISAGVKITCSNSTTSNSKSVIVATQGSISYKDNIAAIFGLKQLQSILEIKPEYVPNIKENIFKGLSGEIETTDNSVHIEDVEIDLSEDSNDNEGDSEKSSQKSQGYKNEISPIEFTGYISSCEHGSGRSSTDRQFFYVNKRPCEPTKIIKLINEIYRQFNPNQYPFVFLNIDLDKTSVDVNVTPDKRKVFLTKEKIILHSLKSSLLKLYENIPRTLKLESSLSFSKRNYCSDVKADVDQPRIFQSFLSQFGSNKIKPNETDAIAENVKKPDLKRKSATILNDVSTKSKRTDTNDNDDDVIESSQEIKKYNLQYEISNIGVKEEIKETTYELGSSENCTDSEETINKLDVIKEDQLMYLDFTENVPNTQIRSLSDVVPEKVHKISCGIKLQSPKIKLSNKSPTPSPKKAKIATDREDLGKSNRKVTNLKTSLEHIKALNKIYEENKSISLPTKVKFKSEINPVFNKKCEEELSREISKDSFKQMEVIGQFNLGFIITKLGDDLFIIDQHATDEIYNFETLQKNTELTSQKLVVPQQLELTGVNEQILMDNLDVFKKNGFSFEINEAALPTKRVKLLTLPMSKNWIFGKDDIEELLFMLRESPSEFCRPSRVRAMFASRACRKSVMIGTALKKSDMKVLVEHMAEINKPWNCPHGRPTIRHLVNLAMVHTKKSCDDT